MQQFSKGHKIEFCIVLKTGCPSKKHVICMGKLKYIFVSKNNQMYYTYLYNYQLIYRIHATIA